jgi:hypothetical protein
MNEIDSRRRKDLALVFLENLDNVFIQLENLSSTVEDNSQISLQNLQKEQKDKLRNKVEAYNGNIQKAKDLADSITELMNKWNILKNDEDLQRNPFYPIKLLASKKSISKNLNEIKDQINALSIKNRLLHDDIDRMENSLKNDMLQQMKHGSEYKAYEEAIEKKNVLIQELTYLLPTIPGFSHSTLDVRSTQLIMNQLKQ